MNVSTFQYLIQETKFMFEFLSDNVECIVGTLFSFGVLLIGGTLFFNWIG